MKVATIGPVARRLLASGRTARGRRPRAPHAVPLRQGARNGRALRLLSDARAVDTARSPHREEWHRPRHGVPGNGKSCAARAMAARLHSGLYKVFYVPHATGNPMDLYKSIAWEMCLAGGSGNGPGQLNRTALGLEEGERGDRHGGKGERGRKEDDEAEHIRRLRASGRSGDGHGCAGTRRWSGSHMDRRRSALPNRTMCHGRCRAAALRSSSRCVQHDERPLGNVVVLQLRKDAGGRRLLER